MGWRQLLPPATPRKERNFGKDDAVTPSNLSYISDLPDSVTTLTPDIRRQRALAIQADSPGAPYVVAVNNPDTDPVIVTVGTRGADGFICDLQIPKAKFDLRLLSELIERHGGTLH